MAVPSPAPSRTAPSDVFDERVRRRSTSLDPIFNPRTVLVVAGGTAGDPAAEAILSSIAKGFEGKAFAVALEQSATTLGIPCFPSVADVPSPVDLAVLTAPAARLPDTLRDCVAAGIKGVIVTQPCYGDRELYSSVEKILRNSPMRMLGPNCSVLQNPFIGLNVSRGASLPVGGSIALISQSGSLCHTILEWSFREIVGFSALVSIGGMADVDWGDLIDHFGADPNTRSIILFMESIGDARSFLSAAREVALTKPIIVVKTGTSDAAARIVAAHTGLPAGNDEVMDAAFRRAGVLRVGTVAELFSMADVLSKQPRPQGPRLVIVSNAAGLSALAADCVTDAGCKLPLLSPESRDQLQGVLQSRWRTENPVHVPAGARPETSVQAAEIALRDPNCDGLLLLTAHEGTSAPAVPGELLVGMNNPGNKPVLACFMREADDKPAQQVLTRACIPTFSNPRLAARAFGYMWQYAYNLRALYETPMRPGNNGIGELLRAMARRAIVTARSTGRNELNECEQLFAAYGIRILTTHTAARQEDAVLVARDLGFPVTLEMTDTEIAGAPLRFTLPDEDSIRQAWRFISARVAERSGRTQFSVKVLPYVPSNACELRVSSRTDPQFGPVLLFGPGGALGEALPDRALALPPLNATLAQRMVEQTRIHAALKADGRFDLSSLLNLLVHFSQLVIEQPWVKEATIDPVLLSSQACIGLNATVALHGPEVSEEQLPKPAIRPYPVQYVSSWRTKRGDPVTIRPIQPEDEPLMIKFHQRLSDHSVYLRYFQMVGLEKRTAHDRLTRICFIDYDREIALVAEHRDPQTDERRIVGVGNLGRIRNGNEGEAAVIVSDDYQGHGLGTELLRRLLQVARVEEMTRVIASTMLENKPTIAMLKRVGFQVTINFEDHVVDAEIGL